MEKINRYRECIQKFLQSYAQNAASEVVEAQVICDTQGDHYQLTYVGWRGDRRVYGPVLHFDIKNSKIWIQWNGTELNVADELVLMGVEQQDIVLGFHPENMRKYTEFAVG